MRRIPVLAASLTLIATAAHPDASLPAGAGAIQSNAKYAPSEPLPPGFAPLQRADCEGKPGYIETRASRPHCEVLPPDFAGEWRRESSMSAAAADVQVRWTPAPARAVRPSLKEWAKEQWPRLHGSPKDFARALRTGQLRIWAAGEVYNAEAAVFFSCRECDPIWRARRVREDGAGSLFVDVAVYGVPRSGEAGELRRAFLDGPLGAPPAGGPH